MDRTRIAEIANKIAKTLVAKDYEYIYDPEHKKHPGGGYQKTQKGWQKGKQKSKPSSNENFITPKMTKKQKELDEKARSKSEGEVWSVAKNPKTHPNTLNYLSYNQDWYIRLQVADNPNTSNQTLHRMKNNDTDDHVKDHASFALSRRKNQILSKNGFDITRLSPEMKQKVKDWDAEDIAKFIGWLKANQ